LIAEAVAIAGLAYAQGVIVDAAPGGLTGQVVVAVLTGAAFYAVTDAGWRVQHSLKYDVADAVELELAQDLLGWTSRSATIEHLEEPEYLDKLTVVLRNSQTLAYATWALLETVASLGALVVSVVVLGQIHPLLMALALFGLPPILLAGRAGDLYMQAVDRNSTSLRLENKLHTIEISPDPLKELLVAGSGPVVDRRARDLWREMTAYEMHARGRAVILTGIGWAIYVVGVGLALWWTITLVQAGRATVGDVAVVIALAANLQDQIMGALSSRVRVAEAGRVIDHYTWLDERTSQFPEAADPLPAIRSGLKLENVSFRYPGTEKAALAHVDLDLPAGSVLGVVGVNGAGKSTLAKVLTGLYPPTSGRILVDGEVALPGQLSLETAGAFQDYCEFQFLARETVGVGDLTRVDDLAVVEEAARKGRASDLVERLADRWQTQLGAVFDGARLSKGEWQRMALARGLMKQDPVILVLDEPTAALDPQAEHDLFVEFAQHARDIAARNGAITVLISHRFSTVTMTDQIVVLDEGSIAERGTHAELMSGPSRYRLLYESQARGYADER
jgi:ATP-binding cassette, subfamily B, bacterial